MSRPYTCCAQGRPGGNQLSAPARGQAASRDGSRRRLRQPGAVDAVLATLSNRVCKSVRHTFGVPLAASARRAGASPRLLIVSRHPMTATVLPKALSDSGSRQIDCAVHLYHCALRGGMMLLTRQAAAMTSFFACVLTRAFSPLEHCGCIGRPCCQRGRQPGAVLQPCRGDTLRTIPAKAKCFNCQDFHGRA